MKRCLRLFLLVIFMPLAAVAQEYRGAEIYSTNSWKYGKIEMRMRMAKGSGILSTFFTYKNGSEVSGEFWEEIDIEVFGKGNAESFQSNIITGNPRQYDEDVHDMPFSLADDYHTYTLEWTPMYVAWYVDGVEYRRTEGGQVNSLTNSQSLRMNIWSARDEFWVGPFDTQALPAYQFVNWISYSAYTPGSGDNGTDFTENWRDDFNSFDANRWARANWTFDANQTPFVPENVVVKDGYLVLALTQSTQTGYNGTVPVDAGNVVVQEPYNGTPHPIPGRIEAEEYDLGGQGVAFNEANANGNEGNANFRADEVGIESTGDTDGEYNIAYTLNGEWLEYTVNVTETGQYDLALRLAKDGAGGQLHVEMDGVNITGTINVPNTGAWQTYETVTINDLSLTAGEHIMRIAFDSDYMNLNYVTFSEVLVDSDNDGTADINDACPNDPNKAASAGDCGCGNAETDSDADGIPDCVDTYPNDADNDGVATTEDCNDNNDQVGAATTWYQDLDGDGLGNSAVSQEACTQPPGYVATAGDNNDTDKDNDGISTSDDCNDENSTIGAATIWYLDADGDGVGVAGTTQESCTQPANYVATAGDNCPQDINKTQPGDCGCGETEASCLDCAGIPNGTAAYDDCGVCGGSNVCVDCNGEPNGGAAEDVCGTCAGGSTGITPVINPNECIATGIEEGYLNDLKVYPNPTTGMIHLPEDIEHWQLSDMKGQQLFEGKESTLNISDIEEGLYLLTVDGVVIKIIKK